MSFSERFILATAPYDVYFRSFRRILMIACVYVALDVRGIEWALLLGAWLLYDLDTLDRMFDIAKVPVNVLLEMLQEMFVGKLPKAPKKTQLAKKMKKVPTESQE